MIDQDNMKSVIHTHEKCDTPYNSELVSVDSAEGLTSSGNNLFAIANMQLLCIDRLCLDPVFHTDAHTHVCIMP